MKKFVYVLMFVALIAVGSAVFSCSSDEPVPEPMEQEGSGKTNYGLNKKDSLFMVDMISIVEENDAMPDGINWDPEDVDTWNCTNWEWDDIDEEYRLAMLIIQPKAGSNCAISSKIKDCEYLNLLWISGGVTSIPEEICDLRLEQLYIINTPLTELPDNIFNEGLRVVRVEDNPFLTRVPSSITRLVSPPGEYNYFCLANNAFTGEVPHITKAKIIFWSNEFTSCSPSAESLVLNTNAGVYTRLNKITGIVPDSILSDTIKLVYFNAQVKQQREGYGFSNLPSDKEVSKMLKEWQQNHPEVELR